MGWKIAFPIPEDGKWPRHGHGIYLRPDYTHRTPPFLTWAQNSTFSHLGSTHLRTRSTFTDVGLPSGFPNPLPSWRQALSEQGCGNCILPSPNSACFSWIFFPSNAFMALARSLLTSNRSKKMNCKLSCKAVRMTIASKEHW